MQACSTTTTALSTSLLCLFLLFKLRKVGSPKLLEHHTYWLIKKGKGCKG